MPTLPASRLLAAITVATLCLAPDLADAAFARAGTPTVQFTALGPAGLKIVGTTHDLDVRESDDIVNVSVPLASLDTGISLRNKHMREKYLEVDKYPRAELAVARSAIKVPTAGASTSGDVEGAIAIHGVSRKTHFTYQAKRDERGLHVSGAVHVNMNEHGISVPSYLGVTVKPEVDVALTFDVTE